MLIAIVSDTHMPRGTRRLPVRCRELIAQADHAIHAGDIATLDVLREIEAIGTPLTAVCGNVDSAELGRLLPLQATVTIGGARIAVVHDAGPARGRLKRMRTRFPSAAAVVFGHSHLPLHEQEDGFQIFNPGSPTERRRAPTHTIGRATVASGRVAFELIEVGGQA